MIQRAFDAIDWSALEELVENKVAESKTLEYKQTLQGTSDSERKEFLADVSSFANAAGGDIIYGIAAETDEAGRKTGSPVDFAPIASASPDEVKLRLEEVIRNGVEPRMRVQPKILFPDGTDRSGFVLILRVPPSFSAPHMVTYKGSSRFYSRNSAGKYRLDVHELRSAFLATDSQADRVRRFREDRLARIVADETPVTLSAKERLVLHVIPLQSFLNNERLDLSDGDSVSSMFPPMNPFSCRHRYNLDGLLTWNLEHKEGSGSDSYCQVFFNGAVEAVDSYVAQLMNWPEDEINTVFPGTHCERSLIRATAAYFEALRNLDIAPPVVILVGLLHCRGAYIYSKRQSPLPITCYSIDRDALLLPEVVAEALDVDTGRFLKPVFDAMWNAGGYAQSPNFGKEGDWAPRR